MNNELLNFTTLLKAYYLLEPGEIIETKVPKEKLPLWDYFQEGNLRIRVNRDSKTIFVKRIYW